MAFKRDIPWELISKISDKIEDEFDTYVRFKKHFYNNLAIELINETLEEMEDNSSRDSS